ncbi:methyltransferase family protein [Pseudorhodobacter ferrugineus]|uniref:methyltransferase family protein n=1 Tax=Pseudorhodobacter ferrugineus TaxID=77008 RepID=UPI0003B7A40E|nr:isoprenylcysteine carboxylmethyltransferase family protein [Pseudorhodobacter ferrugineus]
MLKLFDWPPVWLGLCLAAAWGLAQAVPLRLFGAVGDVAGVMVVLAGLAIMAMAVWEMGRARTTVIPRRAASQLITSGVFGFSRNPIYLGDSLVLIGACLMFDTVLGFALVPAFVWVINQRFIEGEEAHLTQAFGDEYREWCAKVRRWV